MDFTSGGNELARRGKRLLTSEGAVEDENVLGAPDDVYLTLQATPVVEAITRLGTLPVGKHADELRDLILERRAVASAQGGRRAYAREVAAQFRIPLPWG